MPRQIGAKSDYKSDTFREYLKMMMRAKKITQSEMAQRLGMPLTTFRFRLNKMTISFMDVLKMLNILDVDKDLVIKLI